MMALRGVRSSWLMLARNWLLARLAASAPSLARRSATPARSRSTTRPSWVPTLAISSSSCPSGSRASPAKNSRTAATSCPTSTGKPKPALRPTPAAVSARGRSASLVMSTTQAGLPLARTRPGSPRPGAKRDASVAARNGANRSGSARCQTPAGTSSPVPSSAGAEAGPRGRGGDGRDPLGVGGGPAARGDELAGPVLGGGEGVPHGPPGVGADPRQAEPHRLLGGGRLVRRDRHRLQQRDRRRPLAERGLGPLALGDVAPRPDDLERLAGLVAAQAQLVADPAVRAVLVAEPILAGVVVELEQAGELGQDAGKVVGVDPLQPEARALEIVPRLVAEQPRDVLADKRRRVVALGLEAVEHGRGGGQDVGQPRLRREQRLLGALEPGHVREHGDGPAVSGPPLADLDPAAVALDVQQRTGRVPVQGEPPLEPLARPPRGVADEAALGGGAGDRGERGSRHDHVGDARVELPVAVVAHDQPVLGVEQGEALGDALDRV